MRTYGRNKAGAWVEILDTSLVWLATLVQTLRLGQGESPFWANYGLPAQHSVVTQIAPDAAVARTQAQYAPYFASLTVSADTTARQPTFNVQCVLQDGSTVNTSIAT